MIGNVMALAISMMTEGDFWDKFQKNIIHNFMKSSKKRKPRRRKQVVPSQPNDIPYSKYRIEWTDALSDSGWADDREFTKMKLAKPLNEGWVFSKDKNSVKIFASYDKDPSTNEITFGDRTMIPTSWVLKMTKLD
jgi:hypothetical protein